MLLRSRGIRLTARRVRAVTGFAIDLARDCGYGKHHVVALVGAHIRRHRPPRWLP